MSEISIAVIEEEPPSVRTAAHLARRMFQKMYHLRETGDLDEQTIHAMTMPRCGMADTIPEEYTTVTAPPDQPQNFFVPGLKPSLIPTDGK